MFALDQYNWLPIFKDCIINLFALFCANITGVFRYYLMWIKHIIPHHLQKWHEQSVLCGLLRYEGVFQFFNSFGKLFNYILEVHKFYIKLGLYKEYHLQHVASQSKVREQLKCQYQNHQNQ